VVDADTVVTGSYDNTAIVWQKDAACVWQLQKRLGAVGNKNPAAGHTSPIEAVAVVDADTIVTGSWDDTAIVWHKDAAGEWQLQKRLGAVGNQNPAIGHTLPIEAVAVIDPNTIVTGSDDHTAIIWHKGAACVWQVQQRLGAVRSQNPAGGHTDIISAVTVVDADTIVTGSCDRTAIVWHKDAAGVWQLQQRLGADDNQNPAIGHTSWIRAVTVVDPNTIVTVSWDRTAIIWHKDAAGVWYLQARSGAVGNDDQATGHTNFIYAVTVVDADTIVTGSSDHTAIVWYKDAAGEWQLQERLGVVRNQNPAIGHTVDIRGVAAVDTDTIVTGSMDHTAIVWHRDIEGHFAPQLQAQLQAAKDGV
jgi:WD40 repeat protein